MGHPALSSKTLTIVTSEVQGDLHLFLPDDVASDIVRNVAGNLSIRVQQAVHVFYDDQLHKYRLCPVPSGSVPILDLYGELWHCCDLSMTKESRAVVSSTDFELESLDTQSPSPLPPLRVPRPCNSWILYRQAKSKIITNTQPGCTAAQISTIIAGMWRAELPEVKAHWQELARKEVKLHAELYPGYKYLSRKKQPEARGKHADRTS